MRTLRHEIRSSLENGGSEITLCRANSTTSLSEALTRMPLGSSSKNAFCRATVRSLIAAIG